MQADADSTQALEVSVKGSVTDRAGNMRSKGPLDPDKQAEFETYKTGGNDQWERPDVAGNGTGFDHTESFYAKLQVQPTDKITGTVEVNVLGNVAANPIDEIFYERRGRAVDVVTGVTTAPDGTGVETTTRTLSAEMRRLSGRTSSCSLSLVRTRSPTMRTAPTEMIWSRCTLRPVVSQSSATHSPGGGASHMKRKRSSPRW